MVLGFHMADTFQHSKYGDYTGYHSSSLYTDISHLSSETPALQTCDAE